MPHLVSSHPNLEQLAQRAPLLAISRHQLNEIAALAMLIAQNELRRRPPPGLVLSDLTPWGELGESAKNNLAGHVARVVQSLVLLGWIEMPS